MDQHTQTEATRVICRRIVTVYRGPEKKNGKTGMHSVVDVLTREVPALLYELITSGWTLRPRVSDVVALRAPELHRRAYRDDG